MRSTVSLPKKRAPGRCLDDGFTLLEVLVAMAIVSLGLIGVFSALSQMLGATALLRDKTLATWIATDRITEMRVIGEYPDAGERKDFVDMAGAEWAYKIKISAIPEMEMRRLDVSVGFADDPDNVIATVIGFIAPPRVRSSAGANGDADDGGRSFGEGWEPLGPEAEFQQESQ